MHIGVRGFIASGLIDFRVGAGLGMFNSEPESESDQTDIEGGVMMTGGIGVDHGLISASYIHSESIANDERGDGLGLLVDATTIAKLLDRD